MTLRDQLTDDTEVLIDTSEFADTREVDGASVSCILDSSDKPAEFDGVILRESTLYVKAGAIDTPVVSQRLTIDDKQATVMAVDETDGLLTIRLRWFDS